MDAVIVIAVFLLALGVPFAIAGLWWWFAFWWAIGATLGITEIISKVVTGRTISQRFWDWRKKATTPKWQIRLIFGGMVVFWGYLLCHLFLGW